MFTVRHMREDGDSYQECDNVKFRQAEDPAGTFKGALELYYDLELHALLVGGRAYVMNGEGKTVGSYTLPAEPLPDQVQTLMSAIRNRGDRRREREQHEAAMGRLADYRPGYVPGGLDDGLRTLAKGDHLIRDPMRGSDEPHEIGRQIGEDEAGPVSSHIPWIRVRNGQVVSRGGFWSEAYPIGTEVSLEDGRHLLPLGRAPVVDTPKARAKIDDEHERQWGKPPARNREPAPGGALTADPGGHPAPSQQAPEAPKE